MSSLCELVECWSGEIRSGWRPLFACLRRWPPSDPETGQLVAVSDDDDGLVTVKNILAAFTANSHANAPIFANAAMDAILCLLHYLKCSREYTERAAGEQHAPDLVIMV